MTDRELLEKAARAAGYQVEWVRNSGCFYRCEEDVGREEFNPLDDDGDALRLSAALHIEVEYYEGYGEVQATLYASPVDTVSVEFTEDRAADVRRAITLAAAAMTDST